MRARLAAICVLLCACHGAPAPDATTFDSFAWLAGNWRGAADGMPFYEEWQRVEPLRYVGRNYRICAGRAVESDASEIRAEGDAVVYRSGSFVWTLDSSAPNACTFTNREHRESIAFRHDASDAWHAELRFPSRTIEYDLARTSPRETLLAKPIEPLAGLYSGSLTCQGAHRATSIRFDVSASGSSALVSTPDTLQRDVPAVEVCWDPPFVSVDLLDGERALRLPCRLENGVLRGTVREGELEVAVELARVDDPVTESPSARVEPVTIVNGTVELAGLVFLPREASDRPRAGVVIVCGSGQKRKEEYNGWAELLCSRGVAVLAYDKRNVTDFPGLALRERSTDIGRLDDLVADARAAVALLASHAGVDRTRVGILGFSQGAVVAPIAAAADPAVAFVVAVSGNATTDAEFIVYQNDQRLARRGASDEARARVRNMWSKLFEYTRTKSGADELQRELDRARQDGLGGLPRYVPNDDEIAHLMTWNGWQLDVADAWKKSSCPALVVLGELDDHIPAARSAEILEPLFASTNGARTVRVFPRADHQVRVVPSSDHFTWPSFAPGYLDLVCDWIAAR